MKSLKLMKKLEIIVPGSIVPAIKELLKAHGVEGYTMIENISGLGHSGYHAGKLMFNEISNQVMFLVVVSEARQDSLVDPIVEYLSSHSGVLFVSDTYVSRPNYINKQEP